MKFLSSLFVIVIHIIYSLLPAQCSVIDNRIDTYFINNECNLPVSLRNEIHNYQPIVDRIVDEIVNGKYAGDTYKSLEMMTDKFGPRLSGSESLERSIDYMINQFKQAGLENVHKEAAQVPHWVRGDENARMILPRDEKIEILGLGTSVGTRYSGISADAVVVESFDELNTMPDNDVKGKIVVFAPPWMGYDRTVQYRLRGASEASKKGAAAALIRSATPFSIGSVHTGLQVYSPGVKKIPSACITVEYASRLLRLYKSSERIQIHLEMGATNNYDADSYNTIGELSGTLFQNKSVVVVSGHLDSWDVGVGAMDDGGGAFIAWKSLQYLKALNLRPKRTLRAILWTAEEFGYIGAKAYEEKHKDNEREEFNFFMESDIGTFDPLGLDFSGNKDSECIFKEILTLMKPLNATKFASPTDGGPDISLWVDRGFPGASLLNKNEKYFWFHHSAGDSMLVENSESLDKCTALFAAASYIIADLSIDMPKDVKY